MEKYYKLKYSKLIIIIFYICIHHIILKHTKNILNNTNYLQNNNITNKLCICTIGKGENNYIKEFIIHYIKFGVNKIFLYDNNNINDERFEEVINDYIKNGFVEIFNFRGFRQPQHKFMNDCYKKNYQKYDWLIFYDIDEFIYLHNYKNIQKFLNQKLFNDCEVICLNWIEHTDNNKLYYENKSLIERFKEIENLCRKCKKYPQVKPILRGHIPNIRINHLHTINNNLKICNGFGHKKKIFNSLKTKEPDYKKYYINHYFSKSTEEFIKKINRGDALFSNSSLIRIRKYYEINGFSKRKIEMIEKATGLNLFQYKILYGKKKNRFNFLRKKGS